MSADDYMAISKKNGKFVVKYGCASNDWSTEKGTFDTLEEAVICANKQEPTEYGLSINLDEEAHHE